MARISRISELALLAASAIGGYFASRAAARRDFQRGLDDLRHEVDVRLDALAAKLQASSAAAATPRAAALPQEVSALERVNAPATISSQDTVEEVLPEMLLVIAAAVTAFLGKKVRIRSARILYSQSDHNPWSQQGRVFVQASHNIAQRSR